MTVQAIDSETRTKQRQRELAQRRDEIEENLRRLYARQETLRGTAAQPDQLQGKVASIKVKLETPQLGQTFEQAESLRREIYDREQQRLAAEPGAEQARTELQQLDGEIDVQRQALAGVQRSIFDAQTLALLRAVIEPAEQLMAVQRVLDAHTQEGRERGYRLQDVGVHIVPHPAASRTDPREHAVADYLRFTLARLDPEFALREGEPAELLLRAHQRGAGITRPGLTWSL